MGLKKYCNTKECANNAVGKKNMKKQKKLLTQCKERAFNNDALLNGKKGFWNLGCAIDKAQDSNKKQNQIHPRRKMI
jgi:hypothetical protein